MQKLNTVKPLQGCETHPVQVGSLDLASLDSIRAFAASFNARRLPLALLICNAGVMAPPKRLETQDGCEQQFQVYRPHNGDVSALVEASTCPTQHTQMLH